MSYDTQANPIPAPTEEPFHYVFDWRALHRRFLCVAVRRVDGWVAYGNVVPGKKHEDEYEDAYKWGVPLPRDVADALFPAASDLPYAK